MTWSVMGLLLFGAMLHASWNLMVKSGTNKALETALIRIFCSVIALPCVLIVGIPAAQCWPFLIASVVVHTAYYAVLANAYHHGELGLAYPLMRGVAPMITAVGSVLLISEATLSPAGWAAVTMICVGVVTLGASAGIVLHRHAIMIALTNSVIIAMYTLIDARGVRLADQALQYIAALFLLEGWPYAVWALYRHRKTASGYFKLRWKTALSGGFASVGSYAISLWAMTIAPVAMVAALRETSVLFAALLGAWFLGESLTKRRIVAVLIIIAGAIAIRLS